MRVSSIALAWIACMALSCAASTGVYATHATTEAEASAWRALQAGQQIVVFDPAGTCNVLVAPAAAALAKSGEPLAKQPWAASASVFRIVRAKVSQGSSSSPGHVDLDVVGADGKSMALRYALDGAPGCLWPYKPSMGDAIALVGKTKVFTPWKAECTHLEAAGTSPDSALVESEPGLRVQLEALEIGSASAQSLTKWKYEEPVVPWFRAHKGTLHLRADTVSTCFSDPGEPAASLPSDVMTLLRTDRGRCHTSTLGTASHVECRTSLAVWEGVANNAAVSLQLVRRTLGPLHLLDGKPVTGGRFARTVVSVQFAKPQGDRELQLYQAMDRVVSKVVSGDDGMVRVAPVRDPAVTLNVSLAVHDLVLGDLEKKVTKETSKYEDHKEQRANPDKPKAEIEVQKARDALTAAQEDFARRKQQEQQNHETCINGCNAIADANQQSACKIGCGMVSLVTAETDAAVVAARNRLSTAQTALQNTPDSIEVPIMADWTYEKTTYSRSVSAILEMEVGFKDGPHKSTTRLSDSVTDFEVDEDSRHAVQGHKPDRNLIDRPDSLLPLIAERVSAKLGTDLRAAINQEMQESALRAFTEAGGEAPKAEYKPVDAMAFDAVGTRLRKAFQRGTTAVQAGAPLPLPSAAIELGPDDCLLAVAVADQPTTATLTLSTPNRSHADLRGKSFALIEACQSELGASTRSLGELHLGATEAAKVRWGLYKVSRSAK
ncbi:MAG: hypothetical protein HY898_34915 [Deltaproteobacteria bacterium]|nr:hypothetical protein [Deltaproteobacteria bacterium]